MSDPARILAIDPGPIESAYVIIDADEVARLVEAMAGAGRRPLGKPINPTT